MRLGRVLSRTFRVIAIDCFEGTEPTAPNAVQGIAGFTHTGAPGFRDLLDGQASFAEVIHRDVASRLHFVTGVLTEAQRTVDEDGVANLLDALAETYDFVIACGPAIEAAAPALLTDHVDVVLVETAAGAPPESADRIRSLFASEELGGPEILVMPGVAARPAEPLAGTVAA